MSDIIETGWFDARFAPLEHIFPDPPEYRVIDCAQHRKSRETVARFIMFRCIDTEGGYPLVEGLQPGGIWSYVVHPNGDICTRCGARSSHTIWTKDGITVHRCCRCYVSEGNEPERFHRGCTKALSEIRGLGMCPPVRG